MALPLPPPFSATCFTAPHLLSPEQCALLRSHMHSEPEHIVERDSANPDVCLRMVQRSNLDDSALAEQLQQWLAPVVPRTWHVPAPAAGAEAAPAPCPPHHSCGGGVPDVEFDAGDWEFSGIDRRINLYRYEAGGVFTKHRDRPRYVTSDERSFFTVLIYLSDGFEGGHTTVFSDDLRAEYPVQPSLGSAFVMLQKTLHQGNEVTRGVKWALRCDVMYRRIAGSPSAAELLQHLPRKEQARMWLVLALGLEASGQIPECVRFYKNAYRLDPELEGSDAA